MNGNGDNQTPDPRRIKQQELIAWAEHWEKKARQARLNQDQWDAYEYEAAANRTRRELARLETELNA